MTPSFLGGNMAIKRTLVTDKNRDLLRSIYRIANDNEQYIEGILCAKVIIGNSDLPSIVLFPGNQTDEHVEHAIERAYSTRDLNSAYVVSVSSLTD
jgi:hypothetical protein